MFILSFPRFESLIPFYLVKRPFLLKQSTKFKMTTNALILKLTHDGEIRRVRLSDRSTPYTLVDIEDTIRSIFSASLGKSGVSLSYIDDDGDEIKVTAEIEFQEAVRFMQKQGDGTPVVRLNVKKSDDFEMNEIASLPRETMQEPAKEEEDVKGKKEEVVKEKKKVAFADASLVSSLDSDCEDCTEPLVSKQEEEQEEEKSTEGLVSLDEVVGEDVSQHPFFRSLWTNFRDFTSNVQESIPPNFSEKIRQQLIEGVSDLQSSVNEFANDIEARRKIMVPEDWRQNPFIVRVEHLAKSGQENIQSRLSRWEAARTHLAEIGFTEWRFFQNILIIQHDGNVEAIVNDLLNHQENNVKIESVFERAVKSMFALFASVQLHSRLALQRGVEDFNKFGSNVSLSLNNGASALQTSLAAQQESIQALQQRVDKNVQRLQKGVEAMNRAGEATGQAVQRGVQEGIKGGEEAWNNSMKQTMLLLQNAEASCQQASSNVHQNTISLLSRAIRNLHTALFQVNNAITRDSKGLEDGLTCSQCCKDISSVRYKCVVCQDYNLCPACEAKFEEIHDPTHMLLKIRSTTDLSLSCSAECSGSGQDEKDEVQETMDEFEEVGEVNEKDEECEVEEAKEEVAQVEEAKEEQVKEPEPVIDTRDPRLVNGLASLKAMGFDDEEQLTALLTYYKYNVENVLEIMLREGSN